MSGSVAPIRKPKRYPRRKPLRTPVRAQDAPKVQSEPSTLSKVLNADEGDSESIEYIIEQDWPDEGMAPGWSTLTQAMIQSSCAFFAQEVLTGPPYAPYNGKFLVGEHHLEWDTIIREHDRACILAARDHGKCGRGSELLVKADGSRVRLDEWVGGWLVAWDEHEKRFRKVEAPAAEPNGVKPVRKIVFRTGRELVLTEEHPLRAWKGWVAAKDLQVGDRLAVARELANVGRRKLPEAWLLGAVAGVGTAFGNQVFITKNDERFIKAVSRAIRGKRWRLEKCGDRSAYVITRWADDPEIEQPKEWAWRREFWRKTSSEKEVPEVVFMARDEDVAHFLAGYFDADGSVDTNSVQYYSTSKQLLEGVQHLLTRLGIVSRLAEKVDRTTSKEVLKSWRLIVGSEYILKFAEKIKLQGSKAPQLEELVAVQKTKQCSGNCLDRFPIEVWGDLEQSAWWHEKRGKVRVNKDYEPTREKIRKLAKQENNKGLKKWVEAPVFWDEVVAIEELPPEQTWALMVPGHHTYVANDVVNHNSFFVNFAYPIWKAILHPKESGFIFSATQPQAEIILTKIKDEIESNPKLKWLVPKDPKKPWGSSHLCLSNGHNIYARGYGTKVRGGHPIWIVVDDGLNDETIYSELVRKKQKDYFFTAIVNMIVPGGQIMVIGTPFHADDLYAAIKENKEFYFKAFPAESNPGGADNKALWPARYSLEDLQRKRRISGSIMFTREFLVSPISDDMSLFPEYLFRGDPTEQYNLKLGMGKEFWDEVGVTAYMGVDFAMSSSVEADFTVVWTMGRDKFGNRWIMDIQRRKGMGYQEQLSLINERARLYEPALIYMEANQMQRIFGDELIRTSDLPIHKFVTGVQKNSLDKGVPSLRVLLENGKFRIPRGDKPSVEMTELWVQEMRSFTWHEGKLQGVGGHDDLVMAAWICDQAIRQGGFQFAFGDEEEPMTEAEETAFYAELTGEVPEEGEGGETDVVANLVGPEAEQGKTLGELGGLALPNSVF